MKIFLFIVLAYCTANFYTWLKIPDIFSAGMTARILLAGFFLFMTLCPVLIPIYAHRGTRRTVRAFSFFGFMWLSLLVIFFPSAVLLDAYNLMAIPDLASVPAPYTVTIPLAISLIINLYGWFEARCIKAEHLVIKTGKLPEGTARIRIAQISDLHLGVLVSEKTLDRVIRMVTAEGPDIIVSTGDLVDGPVRHIEHLVSRLKKLKAPLGKFAVPGNHEVYGSLEVTEKFHKDSGFTFLNGSAETVQGVINIAGMDFRGTEAGNAAQPESQKAEEDILSDLPGRLFTILLKHRTDVNKKSLGLFDLQLSGHTHKGQIFPMGLATMFLFKYHSGYTKLDHGSAIYVSRGTGTAGPPVRFLSRPEITIIDITV